MDVRASWARIVNWCHDHAPETAAAIRPPADAALLRQAEQATSGSWPEDLRTWYTLADGTQRTPAGYVLSFYCPLPLQSVMSHWSMWQEIWAGIIASSPNEEAGDLYDIARLEAQPAGTAAFMFLPSYVPIAEDQMGDDMFVDTRSGRLRGCVTEFVKGDADTRGPKWPSVTAMLADLADGLHAGRPVGRWQSVVDHGRLSWDVAAHA
jgi:cell wall assembly regulator SMI1